MKTLSIIGVVWFSISLMFIFAFLDKDVEAAAGWGLLGMLYAVPYSITILVLALRSGGHRSFSRTRELLELGELRDKQVLTNEEFEEQKHQLLQTKA